MTKNAIFFRTAAKVRPVLAVFLAAIAISCSGHRNAGADDAAEQDCATAEEESSGSILGFNPDSLAMVEG
ncbi:MAG: hypothetical protein K2H95_03310, partial [Bacteroidales bacterium]|nr:hypothetical protein [Bacteroidales bacterium]